MAFPQDLVSSGQYRYALTNFVGIHLTYPHENVEEKRRQLEEQEQPIGLLRAHIALLEGTANSQDALTKQGGTSVDAFSIKVRRLINRWAAEVVRSPPANLDIVYAAAISDITCTK
ncbi:hypothetical protein EDD15DRAFT_2169756 [Pisolithus albus]|nr:hypothetical protein EDD15DRAFT_2169756 [Pisolithus albus]